MSIFAKPITQISSQDLHELLEQKAVENVRLEFKREVPGKDETLKKMSSFANTFGGFLVVGAEASSSDGRVVALLGVDVQDGYKQTIAQWCFEAVHPPLMVEVSDPIPISHPAGRVCYVIYVSESEVAPHFLNGRKGLYVRTDEFSARFEARLATENELRHLLDRRKVVLERRDGLQSRARQRFRVFSDAKRAETGAQTIGPHMELFVSPRFPVQPVCEQSKLTLLLGKRVGWRQAGFPLSSERPISQHESAIILRPCGSPSVLEATVWGSLFYAAKLDENPRGDRGIHLGRLVGYILVFLRHAASILRDTGFTGPLFVALTLKSIRGVPSLWFLYGSAPINGPTSELDDEASFSIEASREDLDEHFDRVAMDLLRYVFFAINLPESADSPEQLRVQLASGYKYNLWT
jgi:Schlafen, AlbA_2